MRWISVGKSLGITTGKDFRELGISGLILVVHNIWRLSTKLSTGFSTRIAESCSTIHRLYYYNYFI
jgi:hypothetical protein